MYDTRVGTAAGGRAATTAPRSRAAAARRRLVPWAVVGVMAVAGALCITAVAVSLVPWSSAPGAGLLMDAVDRLVVPVGGTPPGAP